MNRMSECLLIRLRWLELHQERRPERSGRPPRNNRSEGNGGRASPRAAGRGFTIVALFSILWLVMVATTASADSALQRKFIWDEANLKMSTARNETEFRVAADTYLKLVETGVRNSSLFYNLGTAFLMAGQREEAARYLTRAERYSGSNWEIRHNMLIALAGKEKDESVSLAWYRVPLFWHYGLAGSVRMTVAVCAFVVLWLALTLGALGFKRLARPVIMISLVLVIMFGSSVATSLHQESNADALPIFKAHGKSMSTSQITTEK